VTVSAYAKVNLSLEVLGLRADGYHALRSLVVPVSLCDTVQIDEAETFSCDTGYADDLALKAARAIDPTRPVAIRIVKRIPAGGGLGGGSADAAAVLCALNSSRGLGLDRTALAAIGARIGSDVPSLVWQRPVLMEGRGEIVTPLSDFPELHLVILHPGVFCSTPEVFSLCQPRPSVSLTGLDGLLAALASGELDRIASFLCNDLEEPALRLHPEIAAARTALREAGALGAALTGSGSCVFGLAPDAATAQRIAAALTGETWRAWPVRTLSSRLSLQHRTAEPSWR